MSKRSDRRAAERTSRKLAFQELRQHPPAALQLAESASVDPAEPDLLARAQAFFAASPKQTAPVSVAQLQANQANAQLSSGPVTPQGKAIASRNNTRHGLAGEVDSETFRVLPSESQSVYDQKLAEFQAEWQPQTATETDLVHRLATHHWLRLRALRLQERLFDPHTGDITDIKKFELYRRYETAHERGFNKALSDILRLRAFQLRQQNGFESQLRKGEEHEFKIRRLKRDEEVREANANHKLTIADSRKIHKTAA